VSTSTVAERVAAVRTRIERAARSADRDPASVRLVAATKTVGVDRIAEAVAAGVTDLGENRAQELLEKAPALAGVTALAPVTWHFLGALQRNKIGRLAPWVGCWQSIDRGELGLAIDRHAPGARVLIEVNVAGEVQKPGCAPADAPVLLDQLRAAGLDVVGLMTVPPQGDDPCPWFAMLRDLGARLGLPELSMGMTDDFELAVREGATMVRVGRALFGPRAPG
jgi:pyridoxal phosphate enzyme (YggS family)